MGDIIYLNDKWQDEPDLVGLTNTALMTDVGTASEAVLVLSALAGHITYEEIFSVFGYIPQYLRVKVIPLLVKAGHLAKKRFASPEGSSYFYYAITRSGYSFAKELIGSSQRVQKAKADTGVLGAHEFSVGYNLYQLIRLREPFRWIREAPYDNPLKEGLTTFKKGASFYRTDCNAVFESDRRIVYIEEDRARENVSVLYDKLYNYFDKHCFDYPEDVLVFSIKAVGVGIPRGSNGYGGYIYSDARCRDLIGCMENCGIDNAAWLIGRDDLFPYQDYLYALVKRYEASVDSAGGGMSLGELKALHSVLNGGISPMQQADFNRRHENESFKIIRLIAMRMVGAFDSGNVDLLMRKLLDGRVVGSMPTTLLSSRLPWLLLGRYPEYQSLLGESLSGYYDDLRYYGEVTESVCIDAYDTMLTLRNGFIHTGGRIYIEFPMHDIASWSRCFNVMIHRDIFEPLGIQILCVFDDLDYAESFFVALGYSSPVISFTDDRLVMYALCMEDILKGHAVLYAPCGDGEERIMTSV